MRWQQCKRIESLTQKLDVCNPVRCGQPVLPCGWLCCCWVQIQESALQQYEKLESLTQKLDALNPELKGAALSAIEGLRAQIAPHGVPVLTSVSGPLDPSP